MNIATILGILDKQPGAYFSLYSEYAEPGYLDPESGMIALGDWNPRTFDSPGKQDLLMPRIGAILEKLGAELEWEDEWCSCEECGKIFRTEPDSHSWTRSYWAHEGIGYYCRDCVLDDPEEYLEYLEGNPRNADTLGIDLEEHDYTKVDEEYASGWYPGQTDDPKGIAEALQEAGIDRFIFKIDSTGQFDVCFSVWVHETQYSKLVTPTGVAHITTP